jgi:hypothetical protein
MVASLVNTSLPPLVAPIDIGKALGYGAAV